MDPRLHPLIVCRRPYTGRVDSGLFWGRAEQPCTNAMFMPGLGPRSLGWQGHLDFAQAMRDAGHPSPCS